MDLAEMLSVVWRAKWIILLTGVVCASIVALISFQEDPIYSAEAVLVVGNVGSTSLPGREDELAFSYGELVKTREVQEHAANSGESDRPAEELTGVTAATAEDSPYVILTTTDNSALGAIEKVNAMSKGLVAYVDELKDAGVEADKQRVLDELAQIENEQALIRANPNGDEGRFRALDGVRQGLIRQYEELNLESFTTNKLSVVSLATSASSSNPQPWRNTIIGFFVGCIVGLGLGFAIASVRKALGTGTRRD